MPYNYRHFSAGQVLHDATLTIRGSGVQPGEPAPEFVLPRADGGRLRLSDLRGHPVLLRFGSFT